MSRPVFERKYIDLMPRAIAGPVDRGGAAIKGGQIVATGESAVTGADLETRVGGVARLQARERLVPPAVRSEKTIEPHEVPTAADRGGGVGRQSIEQFGSEGAVHP
ncbi:MAG: hypothetical protein SynsKO_32650 [Synoicihabitans sp.]